MIEPAPPISRSDVLDMKGAIRFCRIAWALERDAAVRFCRCARGMSRPSRTGLATTSCCGSFYYLDLC